MIFITSLLSGCIYNINANRWAFEVTQIDKLHALGLKGKGVTVGIIDTGIDVECEELEGIKIKAWRDLVNNRSTPYDDDGHGTYIAALLFSKEVISIAHPLVSGICPSASAVIVKVSGKGRSCTDEMASRAIRFCMEKGVDIILLSMNPEKANLGEEAEQACKEALKKGIFVVVPAGDDGYMDDGDVDLLSNVDEVISVGSIGKKILISPFSSRGNQAEIIGKRKERIDPNKKPELVAPGEDILSSYLRGAYVKLSSTSVAAAFVAGILALLLQTYPNYQKDIGSIELVKEILALTAAKIGGNELYSGGAFPHNDRYGYGLIKAYDAYLKLGEYWRENNESVQ